MEHYTGSYFCTKSCWDNMPYDCRNLVVIPAYPDKYKNGDFHNLLDSRIFFDEDRFIEYHNSEVSLEISLNRFCTNTYILKHEVKKWLVDNVKDIKNQNDKGWCIGNHAYNAMDTGEFSLFFYRRIDAQNFIKRWSIYKKPTKTYNQDTYIKKELNLVTNKLEKILNEN